MSPLALLVEIELAAQLDTTLQFIFLANEGPVEISKFLKKLNIPA